MARRIFTFDPPDRFAAGTVGEPGQRTFYLQAVKGDAVVSVVLEKAQVAVLADRLEALVGELERRGVEVDPPPTEDRTLDPPLVEQFRVGALTLGWDPARERVVVEARAQTEDDEAAVEIPDDDPDGPDLLRARITPEEARAFADRAMRLVTAGRPPCPLCGEPLDPQGHLCPRRNGFVN